MSSTEIAAKFNYPDASNLTQKVFPYLGIRIKTAKESVNENLLTGRQKIPEGNFNKFYKSGLHETWKGEKVFLRSSYEEDYAKELDKKKINYEVESLRIVYFDNQKEEYRIAIPDFYLPDENLIVEIKSEWTLDRENMLDKKEAYLKQGYNFKLIVEHKEVDLP